MSPEGQDERERLRDETARNHQIGPLHGPPRERGRGWEQVRSALVEALTTEPLDLPLIAQLVEMLDIVLTPGEVEAIEEGRAEADAGLCVDGPTAFAELRAAWAERGEQP